MSSLLGSSNIGPSATKSLFQPSLQPTNFNAPNAPDKSLHLAPLLTLPYKTVNDVWSVYGQRGSGKSYFVGKLVEELNRIGVPFIILDVVGAHGLIELPNCAHTHMDHSDCTPSRAVARLGAGESLIVSMKGRNMDEMRTYVTEFANIINASNFGKKFGKPVMVCLEECHNFIGSGQGTAGGDGEIRSQCTASVDKLIREGRQDGVGMTIISQAVSNVLPNARRQAWIKIIFKVMDTTDIKALRNSLIGKSNREVDQIIDRVYNFSVGEFMCVSPAYISGNGIITDKTAERSTKHAGRSYVEEQGDGTYDKVGVIDSGTPSFTFDPMSMMGGGMNGSEADYTPAEASAAPTGEMFTAPGKKAVDYKSVLGISLLAVSLVGIGLVALKKYISSRDDNKELEIEERLKNERRKLDALRQQAEQQPKSANMGDPMPLPPSEGTPIRVEGLHDPMAEDDPYAM